MKLMYDDVLVAEEHTAPDGLGLQLVDGVDEFFVPEGLFDNNTKNVYVIDLISWVESRIFPKERMGSEQLLAKLGLKDYSPLSIAKANKACLVEDGWWLAFNDTDNFRTSTVRGAAGFPNWINTNNGGLTISSLFTK